MVDLEFGSSSSEEDVCIVCFYELQKEPVIGCCQCRAIIHKKCYIKWLKKYKTGLCVNCRKNHHYCNYLICDQKRIMNEVFGTTNDIFMNVNNRNLNALLIDKVLMYIFISILFISLMYIIIYSFTRYMIDNMND